ncbi:prepilin-type N-terminal cleavage/methylation domain-containing protein [Desulfonatronum thiosulfatophilum]|uniref:Prepilin-type N-terminal cleavage/methylation domain-containing protein n=1 Tax=Desulfonatronum thiosulfatophilum TaxID=617002 RepID=A0A1G6EEA9_9BACT|nr:prepilin-type N-terminal cleavage/methylation domain-containing protein [Desulfonatronum thiosulfatophilum]SDB55650.1 prepilin-type N-terminal cleavage/methylation domain-containing protein [Desulfonatronum thiosulfatophilum]
MIFTRPHNNATGFSLVEVLVALVVAATLASGLLALQHHGLNQAREADLLWDHLGIAQEALMGVELARAETQAMPDWHVSVMPASPERPTPWILVVTRAAGREMNWIWPSVAP